MNGKKQPRWKPAENTILKKHYWTRGAQGCKDLGINRSLRAIHCQATKLGIRARGRRQRDAAQIIKKHYEIGGSVACQAAGLENWSRPRIQSFAKRLGLKYLSLRSICEDWGILQINVTRRMNAGMSLYAALTARTHHNAPRRGIIRGVQQHDARL